LINLTLIWNCCSWHLPGQVPDELIPRTSLGCKILVEAHKGYPN
jgi:hypothetical protein